MHYVQEIIRGYGWTDILATNVHMFSLVTFTKFSWDYTEQLFE